LYGAEKSTLLDADQKHLECFEICAGEGWRRSVAPDRMRNEEVKQRIKEDKNILHAKKNEEN
jgi:hypothetical protein